VRGSPQASLSQSGGSKDSCLRLHRRVLQPGEAAFVVRVLEPTDYEQVTIKEVAVA
jgi:hypothetical protein